MSDYEPDDVETILATAGTNTNPFSQIGIINKEKKSKPHNITIKNNDPNEPKMQVNMKYSDKQKYRRYKTKTEPKLFNKIMVDEEDDIVNTIKKAFGIEDKKNSNFTNVEPSGVPYYEEPNPVEVEQERVKYITEIAPAPDAQRVRAPEQEQDAQRAGGSAPRRKNQNQPSTSTEITSDIAFPAPTSPKMQLQVLESRTKLSEERQKALEKAKAEAGERSKMERERLLALSKMAKDATEELKDKAEQERLDKILKAPLTADQEKQLQAHLKKEFVGLTDDDVDRLRGQFQVSGYLPDPDTFGRTPEKREESRIRRDVTMTKLLLGK
jgi:hypothetical protein